MQLRTCSLSPDMLYDVAGREMLTSTSEDGLSYSLYTRTYCRSIPLTDSGALQLTRTTSSDNCEVLTAETGSGTGGEMHKKKSMPAWTEYGPAKRLYIRPCHSVMQLLTALQCCGADPGTEQSCAVHIGRCYSTGVVGEGG